MLLFVSYSMYLPFINKQNSIPSGHTISVMPSRREKPPVKKAEAIKNKLSHVKENPVCYFSLMLVCFEAQIHISNSFI